MLDSIVRGGSGANAGYYQEIALAQPGVTLAQAVPRAGGAGTVTVYLWGEGVAPSGEVIAAVQAELEAQRELIRNSEKIASALELLRGLLSGDEESGGLLAGISQAAAQAGRAGRLPAGAGGGLPKAPGAGYLLEDVDAILHGTAVDFDPALQESIEERLDLLYKLGLKYGGSEEKILEYLEDCRTRLHQIEFSDEERERLEAQYETQKTAAIALAKELSEQRKAASKQFISQVKGELAFLNMPALRSKRKSSGCPEPHGLRQAPVLGFRQQGRAPQAHVQNSLRRRAFPHYAGL